MITKPIAVIFLFVLAVNGLFAANTGNDTTSAINKTLENLKVKGSNILPMMIPTLDHLIKTYGIPLNIDKQKKQLFANATGNERIFLRFMDNSYKAPESEVKLMPGIDRITAAALYCDCYELPKDFFPSINDMVYNDGYSLTHATLALKILEQRKCKYDTATFNKAIALQVPKLVNLVEGKKADSDMGIEAIVMLYISGNANAVKPEWIKTIIAAQQPNGAWGSNDHTTVLALWALLEAERNKEVKP